jgi:hypothetical protein
MFRGNNSLGTAHLGKLMELNGIIKMNNVFQIAPVPKLPALSKPMPDSNATTMEKRT